MSNFIAICTSCKLSCVLSYKFIKMCKQNCDDLTSAIDSISDSFQNTIPDVNYYENLYVTLNVEDFTSQQYYDDRRLKRSHVSGRLNQLALTTLKEYRSETIMTEIKSKRKYDISYDIPEIPTGDISLNIKGSDSYVCANCNKTFHSESKVRRHFFNLHYSRDFKCPKCPRAFTTEQLLRQHEMDLHKSGVCKECGKYFCNKYVLKKHELNHNLRVICSDCGRVYRSKEAFNNHKRDKVCQQKSKKSSKDGEYQCDHCKKTYCTKAYLAKHLKYEHGTAEGFRCSFCSKQFYSKSKLDTHIVKHTQEKKFACEICNGRFGTQMALVYHTRLHTGEKPYSCEYCNAAFISASRRLEHTRRHHMEPNLECDICHSKFKATGSLLKHRKRHFNPKSRLNASRFLQKSDDNSAEESHHIHDDGSMVLPKTMENCP